MINRSVPTRANPERIFQTLVGYQLLYALASALDLHVFTHVAEGKATLPTLEAATGASRRGLERLLDVLVASGLLTREGMGTDACYRLMPESEVFLVESRPSYLGDYICFTAFRLNEQWRHLTECICTGTPVTTLEDPEEATAFWDEIVDLLFPWNYPLAAYAGRELHRIRSEEAPRLLDLAAGSGVWGIAAAQANSALRVVAFDLPGVLGHARQNAERFGVSERFEFRVGDIRQEMLGEAEFEAAILGQICHFEGQAYNRRLLSKVAHALKPGATLIIADSLPNDDRSGPLFTLLYALVMLISTTEGDTYTFAEYESWLREAGFRDIRQLEAIGQKLVLATRA